MHSRQHVHLQPHRHQQRQNKQAPARVVRYCCTAVLRPCSSTATARPKHNNQPKGGGGNIASDENNTAARLDIQDPTPAFPVTTHFLSPPFPHKQSVAQYAQQFTWVPISEDNQHTASTKLPHTLTHGLPCYTHTHLQSPGVTIHPRISSPHPGVETKTSVSIPKK